MKKIVLSVVTILLAGGFSSYVNAQKDISNIFKAGFVDLNTLAGGYLKPAGNSFSSGLGSNWYNTAEVHKPWGFDLTLGVGVVQAPQSDQTFSLTGLKNLTPTDPSMTSAPTFTGKGEGVELNLMQSQTLATGQANPYYPGKIVSFTTPKGVSKIIPTASLQFTIGVPYVNDVSIRLIPTIKTSGFEASLWGIGIKHNFKQWIPGFKDLPFDASVVLAYSKFDVKYGFPTDNLVTPDKLVSDGVSFIPDPNSSDYNNQGMKVSSNAETANLVFSKNFLFFTPYIGFGITNTSFDLSMTGNYPTLGDPVQSGNTYKMKIKNITNPINFKSSEVMANATLGFRLKLAVISVHAQYEFQKYPVASAGFGFTFR